MAKYLLRLKARELRQKGVSVKKIAKEIGVSKGTASIWVRDIILSVEQLESLRKSSLLGAERGRLKNALLQKERWITKMEEHKKLGIKEIGKLTDREFLIAGLALYWGEGSRKVRRIQFCNSDPQMIQFMLTWFRKCFDLNDEDIRCRVGINEAHRERDEIVRLYWSKVTDIAIDQFTKTSFKKILSKKVYENFDDHYGTLSLEIKQSSRIYGKIIGLIAGLSETKARVAQW